MTQQQKRRGLIATAAVLALAAIIRWVPPIAAEYALLTALEDQGFSEITVSALDVNLYTGEIQVESLSTRYEDASPLKLGKLTINLEYLPVASSHIAIQQLTLDGLELDARLDDAGQLFIGNWPLPVPAPDSTASDGSASTPWLFGADKFGVRNSRLSWQDGKGKTLVQIDEITLSALRGWVPETNSPIDLKASINDAPLQISGTVRPFASSPDADLSLLLHNLDLTAFKGYLQGTDIDLRSASLSIDGAIKASITDTVPAAEWQGKITLATPSVAVVNTDIDAVLDTLTLDGRASLTDGLKHDGQIHLRNGRVTLPSIPQLAFTEIESKSNISLSGETKEKDFIAQLVDGYARIQGDISTRIDQLALETSDRVHIAVDNIQHDMHLDGAAIPDKDRPLNIALRKQQKNLQITLPDYDLALAIKAVDVQSDRLAFSKDITSNLGASSISGISVLDLKAEKSHRTLIALDKIAITDGKMDANGVLDIHDLTLDGFALLPGDERLAGLQHLAMSRIAVAPDGKLALGDVTLEGVTASLVRSQKGALPDIERLTALADRFKPTPPQTPAPTTISPASDGISSNNTPITWDENNGQQGPALTIASFTLSGENAMQFKDLSVSPNVDLTIDQLAAGFGKPGDKILSLSEKRNLYLKGRAGRGSSIDLSGSAVADDIFKDLAVEGAIKNIDLYRISPYVATFLARNIKGGQLTDTISLTVLNGQLDMKNALVIDRLDFDALDASQQDAAKDATSLPVELAVSVLSDSDGTIRLELPITGAVDNPDFDLSDVIGKALGTALAGAAVATITAFFPPAALLALGGSLAMGADGGSSMDLPPVQFDPASAVLTRDGQDVIAGLESMLASKGDLQLQFCPMAVASDEAFMRDALLQIELQRAENEADEKRQALIDVNAPKEQIDAVKAEPIAVSVDPQELANLAQKRADAVFDALTSGGTKFQDRMIGCRPVVNLEDTGPGRVNMAL